MRGCLFTCCFISYIMLFCLKSCIVFAVITFPLISSYFLSVCLLGLLLNTFPTSCPHNHHPFSKVGVSLRSHLFSDRSECSLKQKQGIWSIWCSMFICRKSVVVRSSHKWSLETHVNARWKHSRAVLL